MSDDGRGTARRALSLGNGESMHERASPSVGNTGRFRRGENEQFPAAAAGSPLVESLVDLGGAMNEDSGDMPVPRIHDKEKVAVLFLGCNDDFWRKMSRRLVKREGFECSRVSELSKLSSENGGRKVVVLGSDVGSFGMDQIGALSYLKRMNRNLTIVYISEEFNQNTARIIAAGADDIVSRENLRPRDLEEKIEAVLKLHRDNGYNVVEPIFCEVRDGKVRQVDESRVARVQETMEQFAVTFDRHQRQTRHYAVMHAIWTSYQHHIGSQIVDLGCGTGHPMRQFIRDVMIPEFAAEPSLRGPTRILSVDNTMKMLVEAQRGFQRLTTHNMNMLEGHLDMRFLHSDLLALNRNVLNTAGFDQVDTVIASYLIHWANDKEGTVRMIADILERGGKFITVEEWPPLVKPGPHMPMELAKRIEETILPIERKEYYSMLRDHGLAELDGNVVVIKIDNHHKMYGNVFVKV